MSLSKPTANSTTGKKEVSSAPIPLIRAPKAPSDKGRFMSFKLKLKPNKANSVTYDLAVPFFCDGSPEEFMQLVQSMERVFEGSAMNDGEDMIRTTSQLLEGEAKSILLRVVETTRNNLDPAANGTISVNTFKSEILEETAKKCSQRSFSVSRRNTSGVPCASQET